MIIFSNVVFWYHKNKPFGPINATLEAGKVNVIIGHNGAGKSTLIQLMLGRLKQKQGHMKVKGEISYMPDDLLFPRYLKAKEILELLVDLKGEHKEQVEEVLSRVGLASVASQYVKSFSKGMVQRLNIAQSLIGSSDILIMDEPTNGLDPIWIHRLAEIIITEKANGKTIVITTHQLDFALKIADKILILKDNKIMNSMDNNHLTEADLMKCYGDTTLHKNSGKI